MPPKKTTKAATPPAEKNRPFFATKSLSLLQPNAYNARRFKENMTPQRQARFWELVASVREKGILEPLLVRMISADAGFEIIAGERRYRAACHVIEELGISPESYEVPCMIHDLDDDEAFDLMLIENLQREDLSPFEIATSFRDYLDKHGNTPDAVADLSARTGIPAHAIRRQVRIIALPEAIRAAWREGKITQSHAEHFTRLDDEAQALELLEVCLRGKLTVRELAERIGALAIDLDKGFFDQAGCQLCAYNTSVQSGLFADLTPAGKCGGPSCFEDKQGDFLGENWHKSKAHEKFGTNTFRFGHRLEGAVESINNRETAARCLACDAFASIVRLTGAIVSGYDRACIGPRACFEELYCQTTIIYPTEEDALAASREHLEPALSDDDTPINDVNGCGRGREECPEDGPASEVTKEEIKDLANTLAAVRDKKEATPPPPEETAPVYNAQRGERARKEFIREVLPKAIWSDGQTFGHQLRLALAALPISSPAARTHLSARLGHSNNDKIDKLVKKIFEIPINEVLEALLQTAIASVLNDLTMPAVWDLVAERFGVNVAMDWSLNDSYLNNLTKSEIVRIGEEVGIWKDELVEAWRQKHYAGKALLALEKMQLIDCILNSGADLAGRVPAEVLGRK